MDFGEPTHTLVPCWMPKPLPPRNQCTGWFAPALHTPKTLPPGHPSQCMDNKSRVTNTPHWSRPMWTRSWEVGPLKWLVVRLGSALGSGVGPVGSNMSPGFGRRYYLGYYSPQPRHPPTSVHTYYLGTWLINGWTVAGMLCWDCTFAWRMQVVWIYAWGWRPAQGLCSCVHKL